MGLAISREDASEAPCLEWRDEDFPDPTKGADFLFFLLVGVWDAIAVVALLLVDVPSLVLEWW